MKVTTPLRVELRVVIVLALCFQVVLPWLPLAVGRGISDSFIVVMAGRAAIRWIRRYGSERGRTKLAVVVGGIAAGLWAVSNAIFIVGELHPSEAIIGTAGLLSLAAALLLPVGLQLHAPKLNGAERYRAFLDVSAVSGAVLALAWIYVMEPAKTSDSTLINSTFAAMLTGPEVIAAAVALVTMARNLPKAAGYAPRLIGSGAVILSLTTLMVMRNGVEGYPWYTGGCGASFVLAAGLVMTASRAEASHLDLASAKREFSSRWALLPYIPIILCVLATATEQLQSDSLTAELVWVLLVTFSLVLTRQFLTVAIVGRLAVKLEDQQTALAYQAHHDPLTGLYNRAAFNEVGAQMLTDQGGAAVLLIDLDGFKPVNDRLGHAAGDAVLVTVAERLHVTLRPSDLVSRFGGDEFALILAEPTDQQAGLQVSHRILAALSEPMQIEGRTVRIGVSIGLSFGNESLSELLRQADVAMYTAKGAGKGAVHAYHHGGAPEPPADRDQSGSRETATAVTTAPRV